MSTLSNMYDSIKADTARVVPPTAATNNDVPYMNIANREGEKLSNDCAKRVLLDIYCRVIPLDQDYVKGNQGAMKQDVNNFLANKDQNALQYFTSCYEKSGAPLLEFIIRSCKGIGKNFVESAKEELDLVKEDEKGKEVNVAPPKADVDTVEVDEQIEDITGNEDKNKKGDLEYEEFIEKIKKKTIKRIIDEVSELINSKKALKDTEIKLDDTPPVNMEESTVAIAADHLGAKVISESADLNIDQKEMIVGMAIREATLNLIDTTLRHPHSDIREYRTRIRLSKGAVINESGIKTVINMK